MRRLSRVLTLEEFAVYVASKVMRSNGGPPSAEHLARMFKKSGNNIRKTARSMRKNGLFPEKGALDPGSIEEMLKNGKIEKREDDRTPTEEKEARYKAKILVLNLQKRLQSEGLDKFPTWWFSSNMNRATSTFKSSEVSLDEWLACMDWIFTSDYGRKFLAKNCKTIKKLEEYWMHYQVETTDVPTGKKENQGQHKSLWERRQK